MITALSTTARRRRLPLLGALAAAVALGITLTAGTAADAARMDMNPSLTRVSSIPGTDCRVRVSMWRNAYREPGTGAYVTCSSGHSISIAVESDWAPVDGGWWRRWGRSGRTYAGSGWVSNTIYDTWSILGGERQWRGKAYVWVDGVYSGSYASWKGTWVAGS